MNYSVHNHGDDSPVIPQPDGTVLMEGQRAGLTHLAREYAKHKKEYVVPWFTGEFTTEQKIKMGWLGGLADMVMMQTDNDVGLAETKIITHKYYDEVDLIKGNDGVWRNPNEPLPVRQGLKQKRYHSKTVRSAKRKAQKLARRISRRK